MIQDAGLDAVLAQQREFAQRFRHRCAQEAGLTPTADFGSAACSAFYLPGSVRLPQLQESLFALDRIVFAYSRGPGGTPTLNAGHCGQRGIQDIDRATAALADALRMSSV
jgi:aspartate aminotransferase-like enzyme